MRVDRPDQLFHRALEPQRQHGLGHELGRSRPDHVHAQHLIVLLVGDDLHEPFGLAGHLGAAEDAERERADPHVVAALLRLGLGQPDAADLGVAIGAAGHVVVVQRLDLLPREPLGNEDAFRRRDVRELRMARTARA